MLVRTWDEKPWQHGQASSEDAQAAQPMSPRPPAAARAFPGVTSQYIPRSPAGCAPTLRAEWNGTRSGRTCPTWKGGITSVYKQHGPLCLTPESKPLHVQPKQLPASPRAQNAIQTKICSSKSLSSPRRTHQPPYTDTCKSLSSHRWEDHMVYHSNRDFQGRKECY